MPLTPCSGSPRISMGAEYSGVIPARTITARRRFQYGLSAPKTEDSQRKFVGSADGQEDCLPVISPSRRAISRSRSLTLAAVSSGPWRQSVGAVNGLTLVGAALTTCAGPGSTRTGGASGRFGQRGGTLGCLGDGRAGSGELTGSSRVWPRGRPAEREERARCVGPGWRASAACEPAGKGIGGLPGQRFGRVRPGPYRALRGRLGGRLYERWRGFRARASLRPPAAWRPGGASRWIACSTTRSVGPPTRIRCSTLSRRTSTSRRRVSTETASTTASRGTRPRPMRPSPPAV